MSEHESLMSHKELYVLLDSDGDIVETFPENSSYDHMLDVKQSTCPSGAIHRATLVIGQQEHERLQTAPSKLVAAAPVRRRLVARWRNSAEGEEDKDLEREREILGESVRKQLQEFLMEDISKENEQEDVANALTISAQHQTDPSTAFDKEAFIKAFAEMTERRRKQ